MLMVSAGVMLMLMVSAGVQFELWKHQFWRPLRSETLVFCMVFYACDRFGLGWHEFFLLILQALLIFFPFFLFLYKFAISSSRKKEKIALWYWILSEMRFRPPLCSETLVFGDPSFDFVELHRLQTVCKRVIWASFPIWITSFGGFTGLRPPQPDKKVIVSGYFFFHMKKWTQPDPKWPPNRGQNDAIQIASSYSKHKRMTINRWNQGAGGEMSEALRYW